MTDNKTKIFIGSSVEGLEVAYTIQAELEHDFEPTIWSQGIFNLTQSTLSELLNCLDKFEAAIFVLSPDDELKIRDEEKKVIRDNILFELGLFIGRIGPNKTFMVRPKNIENFHIPSDLLGITLGTFDNTRSDENLQAALGPFCFKVRQQIKNIGKNIEIVGDKNSEIDEKYNDLMNKLIQLGGYNRLIENQELASDNVLKSYHKLRAEIFHILNSDFKTLLEMIATSGIVDIIYGDVYQNEYMAIAINSVDFLDNDFIQFNAGNIHSSSMKLPSNITDWFSDRYAITEIKKEKSRVNSE